MSKFCSNCYYDGTNSVQCRICKPIVDAAEEIGWCPSSWKAKESEVAKDNVNHPSHYETGKFECIDVMVETQGVGAVKSFCICNAFKYLYRHKNKNGIEDIKKAIWYLNKLVELEGKA